jgi:hypothetical protein
MLVHFKFVFSCLMFTLLYISQRKYVNKASGITFCIFIFFQYIPVLYTLYSVQPIGPIKNMFFIQHIGAGG